MSQNQQILDHLKNNPSITPLEALQKFGCFRLAARIHDLRDKGHEIETYTMEDEHGTKYARYVLIKGLGTGAKKSYRRLRERQKSGEP